MKCPYRKIEVLLTHVTRTADVPVQCTLLVRFRGGVVESRYPQRTSGWGAEAVDYAVEHIFYLSMTKGVCLNSSLRRHITDEHEGCSWLVITTIIAIRIITQACPHLEGKPHLPAAAFTQQSNSNG